MCTYKLWFGKMMDAKHTKLIWLSSLVYASDFVTSMFDKKLMFAVLVNQTSLESLRFMLNESIEVDKIKGLK